MKSAAGDSLLEEPDAVASTCKSESSFCKLSTSRLSSQPFEIGIQVNQSTILAADGGSW